MNKVDESLLHEILDQDVRKADAYNIRKNGKGIERKSNPNIEIVPKEDGTGLDIYVKENTLFGIIHIPVIITESGLTDVVYNDFHIGKNANVIIIAGCGIHNGKHKDSKHDGIHRFYVEEKAKVNYVEKHYGNGDGNGENVMNPTTIVNIEEGGYMEMETVQIKGIDSTNRITEAKLDKDAKIVITERIMTHGNQFAETHFNVDMNGDGSSANVISRSVAKGNSKQAFYSVINGNAKCTGHSECDAIIMDNAKITALPEITANDLDASLIHEAAIGKIAGEQLIKLQTLGLSEEEAEEQIVNGFLR